MDFSHEYQLIIDKLHEWATSTVEMIPNFVLAVLVLLLFVLIGKIVKYLSKSVFKRLTDNINLQHLLSSLVHMVIIAIGTFAALSILKLQGAVTSLLAGAGVIGLALGFAFQEIASNFIAGTMMSIRKPFRVNDLIETNDFYGLIRRIHLRTTEMETMQGQVVQIPNAMVFKNPIINYTQLKKRRVDITVGVTYGEDLEKAKRIAKNAIEGIEGIDKNKVSIFFTGFNSSSIDFTIRYWIKFTNKHSEYMKYQDHGVMAIKKAFDENDITIPFPIRTLDMGDIDLAGMLGNKSGEQ